MTERELVELRLLADHCTVLAEDLDRLNTRLQVAATRDPEDARAAVNYALARMMTLLGRASLAKDQAVELLRSARRSAPAPAVVIGGRRR